MCVTVREGVNSLDLLEYIIKQDLLDLVHHANADLKYETVNY